MSFTVPLPLSRRGTTHVDVSTEGRDPQELLRLYRLGRELRLTDQILSTDLDTVSIVNDGPAPAWTTLDGDHVSFAMKFMPMPSTKADVAVWLGTNAHELGHVLYSPRRDSPLMARVIEGETVFMRGLKTVHNIVEDQRQERLLLGRFAPWRSYLTAALGHHLVATGASAWLLMAGRTWLPDNVRASARLSFVAAHDESMAREVAQLVGQYQRLVDPGDTEAEEAWAVLVRLHNLFELDIPKVRQCVIFVSGEPDTDEPGEGSAPETADEADADDGPVAGEPCDDGKPGEGDGNVPVEGKSGKPGSGKPGEKPSTDKGSSPGTGTGAGTEPRTSDQAQPFDQSTAREQLRAGAEQQIVEDEEASEDLESVLEALDHGQTGTTGVDGDDPVGALGTATDVARRMHHEVGDALLDLKDESEPGWLKRTDSGRLNVKRLLTGTDADELFDRYDPGQMDASELELVLLLDVSGSMHSQCRSLGEATWAIRQAVDDIEGEATVLTFDSGPHRVLAKPGERPDDRMFVPTSMGGTNPESALREAYRLLADSQARNRLMVILTDGSWGNEEQCERLIDALRSAGVSTVLAQLDTTYSSRRGLDRHHCEFAEMIDDPMGLALLFRQVAMARIGSWR